MPTLTAVLTLTYGDTGTGNVPQRKTHSYTQEYTEESSKIVAVAASQTDFPILLDSLGDPKFICISGVDEDLTIKLGDGVDTLATAISAASGYLVIANPAGQGIDRLLVTTGATPLTGAHIRITAFE